MMNSFRGGFQESIKKQVVFKEYADSNQSPIDETFDQLTDDIFEHSFRNSPRNASD